MNKTRFRKAYNRVGFNKSCARHGFRAGIMCTLYFSNGNAQTYKSYSELANAVRAFGGQIRALGGDAYAFVP